MARFAVRVPLSLSASALLLFCLVAISVAQVDPGNGVLPFSTNRFGVDLATGFVNISFPMRNKFGKIPFYSSIVGTSSMWPQEVTSGPLNGKYQWYPSLVGIGVQGQGFFYDDPAQLQLSTTGVKAGNCFIHANAVVFDHSGASHPMNVGWLSGNASCYTSSASGTAEDGSGYTVVVTDGQPTVYDKSGNSWAGTCGGICYLNGVMKDPDGATISDVTATNLTVTDSLGQQVMYGTSGSPYWSKFQYTEPNGTAYYTLGYSPTPIATNFGCSNPNYLGTIYESTSPGQYMLTSITTPTGGGYTIAYEPTPNGNGTYTGRIAQITLPSGGSISYSYSGGNYGMNCNSFVVPTLTVTVYDSYTNTTGIWTYVNSNNSSNWGNFTVTETDPAGNQTVYRFAGEYQTEAMYYQGGCSGFTGCTGGGTRIRDVTTCYSGNLNAGLSGCQTPSSVPTLPVTQTDTYTWVGMANQSLVETIYDCSTNPSSCYSNVTETKRYDWGATIPPSSTALVSDTKIWYGTWGGSSCSALGGYINDRACEINVYNSSGAALAQTLIQNSATGHPTQVQRLVSSGNYLTSTATYNSNGTVASTFDVNGGKTTYGYANGCNNLLPTSVAYPVDNLAESWTWDPNCNGGVMTSHTGMNNSAVSWGHNDPLWRMSNFTDQSAWTTNYSYTPTTFESDLVFNNNQSAIDLLTTLDGLGRALVTQQRQAPGSGNFDSVETDYDVRGLSDRGTMPYTGTAGQTNSSAPATTTSYDALGRPLQTKDAGGGTVNYTYTSNDVLLVVGPAPSGENPKQRQLEYDGLGRLTSVCELSSAGGSGTCGQTNSQTGFWTRYSYDALGRFTGVTENAQSSTSYQTRAYSYDGIGRLTSETNPESGTTTYFYDGNNGTGCGSIYPGDLGVRYDANGAYTCYAYDLLHRLIAKTHPGSGVSDSQHFTWDSATVNGVQVGQGGRIAEAWTCYPGQGQCPGGGYSIKTDIGFTYDANGRILTELQSTPDSDGYTYVGVNYNGPGAVKSMAGTPGIPTIYYGGSSNSNLDGEGRPLSVSASSGQNPVTNVVYSPLGATSVSYGSNDSDAFGFDSNTGRETYYQFNVGTDGQYLKGSLYWNQNGSLQKLWTLDSFNSANNNVSVTYSYDDLARIATDTNGGDWSQNFTYDPFGNITKSGSISWMPGYNILNRYLSPATYDNNGNLTYDGSYASYTWDVENKMIGESNTAGSVTVTYDALERMVEENFNNGGLIQTFVYSPTGAQIAELRNGQNTNLSWIPLPGGATAVYQGSSLSFYQHKDHLGTSRLASFPNQTVVYDKSFAAFGEDYNDLNNVQNWDWVFGGMNSTMAGSTQDSATLYDATYREYEPEHGRWISPDPAGLTAVNLTNPQTWNRYAYVLNNPLSATDPLGLECVWDDGSFDSADDPDTGSAGGCAGQGGTWVDPDLFENAMLTNGQWNSNYGDWSGSANANLAQNWVVPSGGVNADAIDPNSILSTLSSDLSYGLNFTRSFFGGFTVNFGPGSCLSVGASGFTSAASAAQSAASNVQKYAPVLIQAANPGNASAVSGALYFTANAAQQMGAPAQDVAAYTIAAGAVSAAATNLTALGQSALSAARNPYVLLGAADAALAYGVGKEAVAAYQGKCH